MTTQLYVYGGPMRMHLAYWGVSKDAIATRPSGQPAQLRQRDRQFQSASLSTAQHLPPERPRTLTNTFYYIRGKGYYEQLETLSSNADFVEYGIDTAFAALDTANLVRQQWVYKNQWGWNPRLDIEHTRGSHSLGGSFYYFDSDHWGQVVWAEGITDPNYDPRQRYYQYYGKKWVGSLFAQEYYKLTDRLAAQLTAQVRYQRYSFNQDRMGPYKGYAYNVDWLFFSPRLGLNYRATDNLSFFANAAISSRTPTDASMYDANDPYVMPSLRSRVSAPTRLNSCSAIRPPSPNGCMILNSGSSYRAERANLGITLFWMEFRNEIIPYGGVNRDGIAITVNADRSVHAGIETSAAVEPADKLKLSGNLSFNYNRIKDYPADVDGFNVNFADKTVTGFPDYLGSLLADYEYHGARVTWRNQFVGKQYMDLWNIDSLAINPYYTSSLSLSYGLDNFMNVGRPDLRDTNRQPVQ